MNRVRAFGVLAALATAFVVAASPAAAVTYRPVAVPGLPGRWPTAVALAGGRVIAGNAKRLERSGPGPSVRGNPTTVARGVLSKTPRASYVPVVDVRLRQLVATESFVGVRVDEFSCAGQDLYCAKDPDANLTEWTVAETAPSAGALTARAPDDAGVASIALSGARVVTVERRQPDQLAATVWARDARMADPVPTQLSGWQSLGNPFAVRAAGRFALVAIGSDSDVLRWPDGTPDGGRFPRSGARQLVLFDLNAFAVVREVTPPARAFRFSVQADGRIAWEDGDTVRTIGPSGDLLVVPIPKGSSFSRIAGDRLLVVADRGLSLVDLQGQAHAVGFPHGGFAPGDAGTYELLQSDWDGSRVAWLSGGCVWVDDLKPDHRAARWPGCSTTSVDAYAEEWASETRLTFRLACRSSESGRCESPVWFSVGGHRLGMRARFHAVVSGSEGFKVDLSVEELAAVHRNHGLSVHYADAAGAQRRTIVRDLQPEF